jgi:two-component system sensor histidine kinase CreC
VFVGEIRPSVAEVMEDTLVDTANLLAEVAVAEFAQRPDGQPASSADGPLAVAVRSYRTRALDVRIASLRKTTLDLRVLLTDARGIVRFDSATRPATGEDYSRWRDVARTLRGEYGARTSRDDASPAHSVMYVGAPVRDGTKLLGVLVLAKPLSTIAPFVDRAERKVLASGVLLLGLSLAIGVAVTWWTVRSVRRLRSYALQVAAAGGAPAQAPLHAPALPGELGELAGAMDQMRRQLEGREHLESSVRALTHELKSPLTAIRGAAELLQEPLPEADRQRFVRQVDEQALRLQGLVDRMLELTRLESLSALPRRNAVDLLALAEAGLHDHEAALQQRGLSVTWLQREVVRLDGDAGLLGLAWSNLLANATAFAPAGSALELWLAARGDGGIEWSLRDRGPGVPDFALPRMGERFYSAAASDAARRGSGLGLAIVRQVMLLHGGELQFEPAAPGLRVRLLFRPHTQAAVIGRRAATD